MKLPKRRNLFTSSARYLLLAKGLQSVHLLLKIDGIVNKVVSFSFAVPYAGWFGLIEPVFVFSILYKRKL